MLRSFLNPHIPGYLIFYITNQCNFRCDFCFYRDEIGKGRKADELTIEEIQLIARNLGPLLQLSLTGGEPFLRREFADITRILVQETNARYVTIPTNASLPERISSYLEEILPAFPDTFFRVVFSIEGIGDEHDRLRSMPGSYKKIKKSYAVVDALRRRFPNIVLDCNSVFTARSEATLLHTIKDLSHLFNFDNFSITYARGNIYDHAMKKVSENHYRAINAYLDRMARVKEKRSFYPVWRGVRDVSRDVLMRTVFQNEFVLPCVAGRKLIVIGESGEVLPCEILDRSMGNLRDFDYNLGRIMTQTSSRELISWIRNSGCKCSFECALAANIVWNPSIYPKLILAAIRNIGKNKKDSPDC